MRQKTKEERETERDRKERKKEERKRERGETKKERDAVITLGGADNRFPSYKKERKKKLGP